MPETRTEWAVRIYQYLPRTSEDEARRDAAHYREDGDPEAVAVRREVTTEMSEWWEVADDAAS